MFIPTFPPSHLPTRLKLTAPRELLGFSTPTVTQLTGYPLIMLALQSTDPPFFYAALDRSKAADLNPGRLTFLKGSILFIFGGQPGAPVLTRSQRSRRRRASGRLDPFGLCRAEWPVLRLHSSLALKNQPGRGIPLGFSLLSMLDRLLSRSNYDSRSWKGGTDRPNIFGGLWTCR